MTSPSARAPERSLARLARELAERLDALYATLRDVAAGHVELLEPRFGGGELGPFGGEELMRMRELCYGLLDARPDAAGAGVVFALDRIAARDQQIQWHVRGERGYEPYGFVNDADSAEFYDFLQLPWYAVPRATGQDVLAGPYLDFLGVDEYILTCSVPVRIGDRFAGTAAADVEVRTIERRFLELVRGIDADVALTSRDGRIVCANSPRLLPGDRAPEEPGMRALELATSVPTMRLVARER